MTRPNKKSIEQLLNTNLNEYVHNFLREFALACRKIAIYGGEHPSAVKSIEKPFVLLNNLFDLKKYLNINLQNGYLYILNIRLKESVFTEEVITYMQVLDINAVLFERRMSASELGMFLKRFVMRVSKTDTSNLLSNYLKKNNIDTIEVNSELGFNLFEDQKQYRGDIADDLSLRNLVMNRLPDSVSELASLCQNQQKYAEERLLDFNCDLIEYLVPEKASSIDSTEIEKAAFEHINRIRQEHDPNESETLAGITKKIYELIEFHPASRQLTEKLDHYIACEHFDNTMIEKIKSPAAKIRYETSETIDDLFQKIFVYEQKDLDISQFSPAFLRLLKTNQKDKAGHVSLRLLEQLNHESFYNRQNSLEILLSILNDVNHFTESDLLNEITRQALKNIYDHNETFEYSELFWFVCDKCLKEKNYSLLHQIIIGLNVRRKIQDDITVYDSLVVKKVFTNINQPGIINKLVDELLAKDSPAHNTTKDLLIAIGSEEVALALARIISHPDRPVRQLALKILGDLGKASLAVFNNLLRNRELFERDENRRELPDSKWYVIRNAIFVLGLLKDPMGSIPLRLHINDPDVRVRREIIKSLEKIGGEESVDVLMMMATDTDREIRESAVITIGLIGHESSVPLLISLIKSYPHIILRAVSALGQIGGEEAELFLASILIDEAAQNEYTNGVIAKDDLKLAVVKALGRIGNNNSLSTIKNYQENLSTTQKILFKNSQVNKAIKEILSRH